MSRGVPCATTLAVADHRDAVGQQHSFERVVRDHHGGEAELVMQAAVILAQRVAGERVERAERLVHQHDLRARGDGARDADALPFAAGELRRQTVAMLGAIETHQLDQLVDARGDARVVPAEQLRRDRDVLRHRHVREQADALEHVADPPPQHDGIGGAHVLAFDAHGAAVGLGQPVDQAQQRGLAGAGRPDDGEEFALARRRATRDRAPCVRRRTTWRRPGTQSPPDVVRS